MAKVRSWVGLDVHARSVVASWRRGVDAESGELCSRKLSGKMSEIVEFCGSLPGPTRVAYEAGADRVRSRPGAAHNRGRVRGRRTGED